MTEWFEQWFGEEYHALYPHRDEDDARQAVALIRRVAPWKPGDRVLDLACGPGRHAAELERLNAVVVGYDLSWAMLRRARGRTRATLVRGDMRALPFKDESFALAVNLFTSFGYFLDDAENRAVLGQVVRTLRRGGRFVLDYLNAELVRRIVARSATVPNGGSDRRSEPRVTRRIGADGRFVIKEIELRDEGRTFQERVRLFGRDDLAALFSDVGLRVDGAFGDYDGGPPGADAPRIILVGTRA